MNRGGTMAKKGSQNASNFWWALTLRGIAAIIFGIAAVFWPALTLVTLVYIFGAFILVSGIVSIVQGVSSIRTKNSYWFLTLIIGLVEMGVGVYLLRHPTVAFATVILLIGLVLIVRGVIEGVGALMDKGADATERTLMAIAAVAAVVIGVAVLLQPASAGVAFVWIIGLYALITGPILVALSLDGRKLTS